MSRPKKKRRINDGGGGGGGGNSTTIDDLDDNMLTQILFRLPSCAPIIACKLVNKRWCSLISDPKFASHFSDHKKENTSLSKPWTFIASKNDDNGPLLNDDNTSTIESVFGSPKFSLRFIPCGVVIEATFKDLVLCSDPKTSYSQGRIYYITSPLTKQWVRLPPSPAIIDDKCPSKPWVGLVCQQPYDDFTQNYKFRVVVINHCPPPVYELLVYCSLIGEWKKFNLSVSINPELAAQKHLYDTQFQGVVCNGIIYLYHRLYFAAFNPFDVEETTETRKIEAKVLPILPDPSIEEGYLRESSGKLFIIHNPNKKNYVSYKRRGNAIELSLKVWKMDPNQVPLIWKTTFKGSCRGNVNNPFDIKSSYRGNIHFVWNLGIHPNNDKLIYILLWREDRLVLCDTRTKLIKPLFSLPGYRFKLLHRLELQWWPTSVPKAYLSNTSP
ncbi:F-box protein At5g07610-like [Silene latifolia]|uniref:F-box protein At5g07610-like n=1 Tax=Silene latifolia TaxID=37657 RepID=UPI003D77230E